MTEPTSQQMYDYLLSSSRHYDLLVTYKRRLFNHPEILESLYRMEKSFQRSDEACGR